MKIHCIQHVVFEGPGNIETWASANNSTISFTRTFMNEEFPIDTDFDLLVIMGGPMNIYEDEQYPWLKQEKAFIKKAINSDKFVLGICLGAQLLADGLGASVYKNDFAEIGWLPVKIDNEALTLPVMSGFSENIQAFHWHGDTFDIPQDSIRLGSTEGCKNQGFIYRDKVIGLQFHLEMTEENAVSLIHNCSEDMAVGKYVQQQEEILSAKANFEQIHQSLVNLMNNIQDSLNKKTV